MRKPAKKLANIRIFLLLCIISFLSHAIIASADDQLSGVLDGILKKYGGLKGMSVPYKREIITKSMAMLGSEVKSDAAAGKILFMPPHYLAIQQMTPGKETVTTDGQTVWYYIEEAKTVYEYPADALGREIRLLSEIFSGLSRVGDSFDVMQSDLEDKKDYHLKLIPNPSWEEVDHICLLVERTGYDIRVVEIYDLLGGVTRFTLNELSIRKDLKKEDFRFKAPSGVKTVKQGQ
jgi:outer membrane lipoprotein-sorting protein